jgi:hypothetical protein
MEASVEIKDVYFRRFLVPLVITLLILAGAACIIADVPGTKADFDSYGTVFGAQAAQLGGALKKLLKSRR